MPARDTFDFLRRGLLAGLSTLGEWAEVGGLFAAYVLAYSFGLIAACFAVARMRRWQAWHAFFSIVMLVLTITTLILILFGLAAELARNGQTWPDPLSADGILLWSARLAIPLAVLAFVFTALRLQNQRYLCWIFGGSCWAAAWFGCFEIDWIRTGGVYYGTHVSFISACLLTIGTLGEAAALTRQSWLRTLGQLLTCRLARIPGSSGHCPVCDYNLYGLTEMRCPECGRTFSFQEIGATPEAMAFGRTNSA